MSERLDGPLCADCDLAAVVAVPQEKPVALAAQEKPVALAQEEPDEAQAGPALEERPVGLVPGRVGCRTELRGWAGAHLHGAVRPRRKSTGHGRPPGRWC